jgi:hypothetical protein
MAFRRMVLATAAVIGMAGLVTAQEAPPDLRGTWTGTFTGGVRQGGGQLAPADDVSRFVRPGERDYTLTITEQDGRGFRGTWSSVVGSENLQGVIRLDNRRLLMLDSDSQLEATLLSSTEMELCNNTLTVTDHFSFCFLLRKH